MSQGAQSFITIGIVASVIYGLLFLLSFRQTWLAWTVLQDARNMKFVFHVAMTAYCFFDLLYSGSLILHDGYARWGYSSHVLALFFYVFAFATVIYLWGNTMSFGSRFEYPKRAGLFIVIANLLVTIVTIAFVLASKSFSEFQDHYSVVNLLLTLTHSLCLLILSCSMLFYGIRLQQKLGNSSLKAIPGKTRKIAILLRINIVLLICCVCFFLRVIALAMLCRDIVLNSTFTDDKILLIGWFIISNWLPTTFPAVTLLFIMRVKEVVNPRSSNWTERDTDQTVPKNSSISNATSVKTNQLPVDLERPRQQSESSDFNDDLESEEGGVNPVHHFRASSGESFYIESQSPSASNVLRDSNFT